MQLVFETCNPREDVLTGVLREDIFAARLHEVVERRGEDVYRDPALFFQNTYATEGLRRLLTEVFGRLSGAKPTSAPVIRLETSFGGGKTHNLIACLHVADGAGDIATRHGLLQSQLIPDRPINVAGVVGSELDPATPLNRDGVEIRTPWGEMAYQLADAEAARRIEAAGTAPGRGTLEKLVGDDPTLIMLDEMAWYLRVARAYEGGALAGQTVAFLMSLLELASSKERLVVVLSLADSSDAFGRESEEIRDRLKRGIPRAEESEELREAKRVSARKELIVTPTADEEIPHIVVHRLFSSVDREAVGDTAEAYVAYYRELVGRGGDLPPRATSPEYADLIRSHYPFHPELILTLNTKAATIPNFQRTRGALRLLAMTVRRLWETRPNDAWLIHPHHLDLAVEEIANDLTSRLDRPEFKQVIAADVVSPGPKSRAHAQEIDEVFVKAGKPPFARRAATTVFLHSITTGPASGLEASELRLAALAPDDEPGLLDRALERLTGLGGAWFLHWDERRYRFGTEPSPIKAIFDEKAMVGTTQAKKQVDRQVEAAWGKGLFVPQAFRSEPSEVPDDPLHPQLVILHYDAAAVLSGETEPPELVRHIFERSGTLQGNRTHKNNLVFLVADADGIDAAVDAAREYLAARRIVDDPDRMKVFTERQQKKLHDLAKGNAAKLRAAAVNLYRHVYFPSADAPAAHGRLRHELLPAQDPEQAAREQTAVLVKILGDYGKVLRAEDDAKSPHWLMDKAWDAGRPSMSTEDLRRTFAIKASLPILLDPGQLKRSIKFGIEQGVWIYYDAASQKGFGRDSAPPLIQISEDAELFTLEEAERRGILRSGDGEQPRDGLRCPVCGNPVSACTCGRSTGVGKLKGVGTAAQAFAQVIDAGRDQGVSAVRRMSVSVEGSDAEGAQELHALGLLVPQLGAGSFGLSLHLVAQFGDRESLEVRFNGPWDRYKRLKSVTDPMAQEASKLQAQASLTIEFLDPLPIGGSEYQKLRDVFDSLPLGKVSLEVEPETEAAPETAPEEGS